jgi:hypothetical protein
VEVIFLPTDGTKPTPDPRTAAAELRREEGGGRQETASREELLRWLTSQFREEETLDLPRLKIVEILFKHMPAPLPPYRAWCFDGEDEL